MFLPTTHSRFSSFPEQGGVSRAEAAPSIQRNRESISVSGLHFSPFRCHCYDFFGMCLRNGLTFFELFSSLGIDHDPHVLYVHMTYVYSSSHVSFFTRSHGQEKPLSYYDLLDDFRSSTIRTHPHPHSLLFPPPLHHPETPHLHRSTMVPLGEGYRPGARNGRPANLDYT